MYSFENERLDLNMRINDFVESLTLKEKFKLLSGTRYWWTKPIRRLRIPRMGMSDGPNGVAYHSSFRKNTQFPVTKCLASTWDKQLAERVGVAMGEEVRAVNKHILLAPGINIDRTPLNGRTFEYFSEDPFLTKEMAKPFVKGLQSQNIGACIKHYAANNQEFKRYTINALIDERTLHEIYLRSFEDIVKNTNPWSFMACYNKVNGFHGCENPHLIQDILFNKWKFDGFVMSDWFATRFTSTTGCINAGLSLEMPRTIIYKKKSLLSALDENQITEERIDELLKRMVKIMIKTEVFKKKIARGRRNTEEHRQLAQKIAEEGIVLLKNEGILPLNSSKELKIAIKGRNTNKKMGKFNYGGSSAVIPPFEITPLNGIGVRTHIKLVKDPKEADYVIIFTGLNHGKHEDAEGFDRLQLHLPEEEEKMIMETCEKNPNTIVVLINGGPIAMEKWLNAVPAVIEAWYPGMMGGHAIAKVLFGDINPSGKLPITFPKKIDDSPAHTNPDTYPGDKQVHYREGIYVGYRYFDKFNIEPLFPFGFGLSYTTFEMSTCELDKEIVTREEIITIKINIKNIGMVSGAEVVQVYVSDVESSVDRPQNELVGFAKISLQPQEEKVLCIPVRIEDFAFWDVSIHDWKVESGEYRLRIGSSSRSIIFEKIIMVE
ncbi:MAG: glycoside hydrolase family 3 C-terminal domain-containing protein [Candidatus Lokiarchaeota archaeon]|nr:glycoside hydrolase family 3 C-terminal domain-containing protein [Candidatus Lokiarchaeota archaeon]